MKKLIFNTIPTYMWVILGFCCLLSITGFFLPPMAVIDGSVLTAMGILFAGTSIFHILTHIEQWKQLSEAPEQSLEDDTED